MHNIPLSLYIHIPWCERKCPYCDFNSHLARDTVDEAAYVQALLQDLDHDLAKHPTTRPIDSIFIGGGTPSLFSADSIATLLTGIKRRLQLSDCAELNLEANPSSSEANKFAGFRQAGINRLSIGVQSFNPPQLRSLGRVHTSDQAINAATHAKAAGFEQINLDLMFGLPQQTTAQALADLRTALSLTPSHLSCYQLTIEPNTLFHHQPPITPNAEQLWEMQTSLQTLLSEHQYQQYEVSAYAQQNAQCQHNLNYWRFGDYLGIGAGAHSKLTTANGEITRSWKIKHPTTYLKNPTKIGGEQQVTNDQRPFEFMLNALRLSNGFSIELFEQTTHLKHQTIAQTLNQHQQKKLLTITQNHISPTPRGKQLIDSMLQDYLP